MCFYFDGDEDDGYDSKNLLDARLLFAEKKSCSVVGMSNHTGGMNWMDLIWNMRSIKTKISSQEALMTARADWMAREL